MDGVLRASSPIELQAKADEAGLPAEAREAALSLFHALTSRLGQAAVTLDGHDGNEDWPRHGFLFGPRNAAVGEVLAALRASGEVTEVLSEAPAAHGAAHTLVAAAIEDGFEAVLVACDTPQRMRDLLGGGLLGGAGPGS